MGYGNLLSAASFFKNGYRAGFIYNADRRRKRQAIG